VSVRVQTPTKLNKQQRQTLEELGALAKPDNNSSRAAWSKG